MSNFEKSKIDLKKHYIIHSSASAVANIDCDLYALYFINFYLGYKSIMTWVVYSQNDRRKMVQKIGKPFLGILGCEFLGDVLKKVAEV